MNADLLKEVICKFQSEIINKLNFPTTPKKKKKKKYSEL